MIDKRNYYHGFYPGAVALDAPTVVVGGDEIVVGSVVTGTLSGAWTMQGGWSGAVARGAAAGTGIIGDASSRVPRVAAAMAVNGNGTGLPGLVGPGIHIACAACSPSAGDASASISTQGGDDSIAALSLLGSLSSLSLGSDSVVASNDHLRLEASLAHDALPRGGGQSAIVVHAIGGPPAPTPSPVRVHLVIDTSGSMEARWDEVRDAAIALVGRLPRDDEIEIVVYATAARIALAPTRVGDGERARAVIRSLSCSGQTNIEAGLRAAYGSLAPNGGSVVVLLSDGVPDGGYATPAELGSLAGDARTSAGATTITIGLGSDAAVTVTGVHVAVRVGTVSAGESRTIVIPVRVGAPGAVAVVSARATAGATPIAGQGDLTVREGRQSIPAGGLAASLDADLASALAHAATAVENGDASAAASAVRAHAELARQVASGDPVIVARVEHALAFAAGLEASVPSASWGARRQAASAMLEWSVGLGR